jgi:short-subunit dehydrogenase
VHVLTVKPGYVLTGMTAGRNNLLFAITAERAAADIYTAIRRRRQVLYSASIWWLVMLVVRNIPSIIFRRLTF